MEKSHGPGSGKHSPDLIFEKLILVFGLKKILTVNFLVRIHPGSGISVNPRSRIQVLVNPGYGIRKGSGWKKIGSGIWDKHPGSAALDLSLHEDLNNLLIFKCKIIPRPLPSLKLVFT
jgi:hypothetical protein